MGRSISSAMVTESKKPELSPVVLVKMGFASGFIYVWPGYGDLVWNGMTFKGLGTLGKIEPSTDTSDLSAQGATFILEGVSSASLALAIGQVQQGLPAITWLGFFNAQNALVRDPTILFSGLTDVCKINETGETCEISVTCENKFARLSTLSSRRFTSDDQALDYPGDVGFIYVPSLQDSSVLFG